MSHAKQPGAEGPGACVCCQQACRVQATAALVWANTRVFKFLLVPHAEQGSMGALIRSCCPAARRAPAILGARIRTAIGATRCRAVVLAIHGR
eukprot:5232017-Pleurochrysis_carterae.AAC.1